MPLYRMTRPTARVDSEVWNQAPLEAAYASDAAQHLARCVEHCPEHFNSAPHRLVWIRVENTADPSDSAEAPAQFLDE